VKTSLRFSFLFLIALFISGTSSAQPGDSSHLKIDSVIPVQVKQKNAWLDSMLQQNKYLNLRSTPVSLAAQEKSFKGKEFLFYLLGITILLLAMSKVFYTRYFNNIFRVFFNTSLRQNQLTDLLLQAKLPSLIFNIFFVVSAGLYAWLLLSHYQLIREDHNYTMLAFAVLFVTLIYCGKFLTLKVFGWMSGMSVVTDRYIFVIFLINKIIGILLIPFIILLAFSPPQWMTVIITASGLVIGLLFLLRYLRTYGLLQNDMKINAFHFLLYIAGMEVLPILILYKLVFNVIL
jgi:hypothetical protein